MNQQTHIQTPVEAFKSCFSAVAAYLGRPSAETVLFSGVPISATRIELQEIRHLAERIGLETQGFDRRDFARGRFDLPAIVFRANRLPIALLAEQRDGARLPDRAAGRRSHHDFARRTDGQPRFPAVSASRSPTPTPPNP